MSIEKISPGEIQCRSFEIIRSELGQKLPPETESVILRVIHATADFDYAGNLKFSENAVAIAISALKRGEKIITDTNMAKAGANKSALERLGTEVFCFMSDADVVSEAKRRDVTRAEISMNKAVRIIPGNPIFAIGNAPTALARLCGLISDGEVSPALVIGVPVGFVNVLQSKEMLKSAGVAYIVSEGRKGGSTVAAAVLNALAYKALGEKPMFYTQPQFPPEISSS